MKRGSVQQQLTIVMVGIIIVMALLAHYVKQATMTIRDVYMLSPQMQKQVRLWRDNAELVVIGRVIGIREQVNETANVKNDPAMSYLVLDIAVENVERGKYPGGTIEVFFGWFSPEQADIVLYPGGIKQDYKVGERVKIFLDYDDKRFGFYSPGAYYTIEPVL